MKVVTDKQCPKCKKWAHGIEKVKSMFGYRNNHGYDMVQSYCVICRGSYKQ